MGKRQLGIGKAKKKQKLEQEAGDASNEAQEQTNELTVELPDNVDANDELGELKGLYATYKSKGNELILNGLIHECDRLLRNVKPSEPLPDYFYNIYGLGLYDLIDYKPEEVTEILELSIEKFELGLAKYPENIELLVNHLKVLLNELVNDIKSLTLESTGTEFKQKLTKSLQQYEKAEALSNDKKDYSIFNVSTFEILQSVDDLLEVIDTFGLEESVEDIDEVEPVELPEAHPLFAIRESDEYNQWWRDHILIFLANLTKNIDKNPKNKSLLELQKTVNKLIGQSYLKEAEEPSNIFTTLMYDDTYTKPTIDGLGIEESKTIGIDLFKLAIKHLRQAWDNDEPETWVMLAESLISLGNLYDLDSKDQINNYDEAETILVKANNATNGKYKEILDNLIN